VTDLLSSLGTPLGADRVPGNPEGFRLEQNYPNPFNPSTAITFATPRSAHVRLSVFDVLGQEVERLLDGRFDAGPHTIRWTPRGGSGTYFYRITVTEGGTVLYSVARAMVLLR